MSLRIIAGEKRGARLLALEGCETRPLRDRVRESLFNIIRAEIGNSRVLDLFAGSGAVSMEALSRGAAHATLVEAADPAIRTIERNIGKLGYGPRSQVVRGRLPGILSRSTGPHAPFHVVFIMPPYHSGLEIACLQTLEKTGQCPPGALAIVEVHSGSAWPSDADRSDGWTLEDERTYGVTKLVFLRRSAAEGP